MRWLVTRVWEVAAENSADAIDAAVPGEHHEVRARRIEDGPDMVSTVVRTRHPDDYVLVNLRDGSKWIIVDGKWRRSPEEA